MHDDSAVIPYIDFHAHHQQHSTVGSGVDSSGGVSSDELIQSAIAAGIDRICLGGTDPADWKSQVQLWAKYRQNLFLNFGLHPWWVEKFSRAEIDSILDQLDRELPLVSGLGETGLDFYPDKRDSSRFDDQRYAFRAQLRLALKHQKPVVLHVVNSHAEALSTVNEEWGGVGSALAMTPVPLIIHRFSGTAEDARAWLGLGAYLSFHEPKKMMKTVPIEQMLLETDSHNGVHAGGWDIRPHYEKSAEIMGLPLDAFAQKLAENFNKIGYSQPQ